MTEQKKKPHTRLGLSKRATVKQARDFMDFDYIKKLSDEERDWLAKFSAEYYQNRFYNDGTDLTQPGTQERREDYGRNNARYRDLWHHMQREADDLLEIVEHDSRGNRQRTMRLKERKKIDNDSGDAG